MGNSKKSKKGHRHHKSRRRRSSSSSSDSSRDTYDGSRAKKKSKKEKEKVVSEPEDLTPLAELISSPSDLAKAAVTTIHWDLVSAMLPPCLQGRRREDVIDLVTTELEGMSKKRILSVLEGHEISSSSSSEEYESDPSSDHEHEKLKESMEYSGSSRSNKSDSEPVADSKRISSGCSPVQSKRKERESSYVSDTFSDVELVEG